MKLDKLVWVIRLIGLIQMMVFPDTRVSYFKAPTDFIYKANTCFLSSMNDMWLRFAYVAKICS